MYAANRHGEWMWDLTPDEACTFGPFLQGLSAALKDACGTSHVYHVARGEQTSHLHGILTPRYAPLGEDLSAALVQRGTEIADPAAARLAHDAIRRRLIDEPAPGDVVAGHHVAR